MERPQMHRLLKKVLRKHGIYEKSSKLEAILYSHPHYPSLESIQDTLEYFYIKTDAVKLHKQELAELERPFIAHLEIGHGDIAFVTEISNTKATYYDSNGDYQKMQKEEFFYNSSGIVLLMLENNGFKKQGYNKSYLKKNLFQAILFLCMGIGLLSMTRWNISLNYIEEHLAILICNLLGLFLSISILLKVEHNGNKLIDKFCDATSKSGCDNVLKNKYSNFISGIKWHDLGIIYFFSNTLIIVGQFDLSLVRIFSIASVAFIFYSLYMQIKIIKSICVLCNIILAIFVIQFYWSFSTWKIDPNFDIFTTIAIYANITWIYLLFSYIIKRDKKLTINTTDKFTLKRNPYIALSIFANMPLLKSLDYSKIMTWGNPNSETHVMFFLSIDCKHCSKIFKIISEIVSRQEDLLLQICLLMTDDTLEQRRIIFEVGAQVHGKNPTSALNILYDWYINGKMPKITSDSIDMKFLIENSQMFDQNMVERTPTVFVNYKQVPHWYNIDDSVYFQSTTFSKATPDTLL